MLKIEVTDRPGVAIYCPFCGNQIIAEDSVSHCEHTLFIASDEGGFEYLDPKLGLEEDVDLDDTNMDEFTDQIDYPNAIKFALYQPAPSFFGSYVAFAQK